MGRIHPTALVDPKAELASDVEIGPYCIIGSGVSIGSGTRLVAHVFLEGKLTIGENNVFYPYSSCGVTPQDLKYKGEASETRIGNGNTVREFVTIHRGTQGGGLITAIGDNNLLMAYVHIAHDVIIGNRCILANGVTFAGHVVVEDDVNIGGLSAIHQFVRIGSHAIVGSYSVVKQDVLPYSTTASSHEAHVYGANRIGLERKGFTPEAIEPLQNAFRLLTRSNLNTSQAVSKIEQEVPSTPEVERVLEFIRSSKHGFVK